MTNDRKMILNEYFLPREGIDREVITADICRYLGNESMVRPGSYENPQNGNIQRGYFISSYRNLTTAMIDDLKTDTELWQAEKARLDPNVDFPSSATHQSQQDYGPTKEESLPESSYPSYADQQAPASSPQIVKHLRPSRKCLPIFLNGHSFQGCADYGSEGNVIRQEMAENLGLIIMPNNGNCPVFRLPNGKLLYPYGWTMITCHFPGEKEPVGEFSFFVFSDFIIPLILGRRFLRTTETLSKHFHRLKDLPPTIDMLPKVCYLGDDLEGGQEQISFWLNGEKLGSTPDTGSQLNLISLEFALQQGYKIDPYNCQQMQFADGSVVQSRGSISLHVSFGGDGSRAPLTLLNLVDSFTDDCRSPGSGGKVSYGPQTAIMAEFHVLDCLQSVNLILGVDILATVDAFVQYNRHFRFTAARGLYDLFWIDLLSGIAKVWADSRFPEASRRTVDRMTRLLEEQCELRALDENLIANPPANKYTGRRRVEQQAEDQRLHDMYQQKLDRITREIMAEHARVAATANDANTNQTSNVPPALETIVSPSNALLDNTYSGPFISSAPSNYQAAALPYNPYPSTSTSYSDSPYVAPPPAHQTSTTDHVEPSRERRRHHRGSNS